MIAEIADFDVNDIRPLLSRGTYQGSETDINGLAVRVNLVRDGLVEPETWFKNPRSPVLRFINAKEGAKAIHGVTEILPEVTYFPEASKALLLCQGKYLS